MMKETLQIRKTLLEALLGACEKHYPREFFALLSTREKGNSVVEEFVVVPTEFGFDHAVTRSDLIPFDETIVGTIHSHPDGIARPSQEDVRSFSTMGKMHLIAKNPFNENNVNAFNRFGKKIDWNSIP